MSRLELLTTREAAVALGVAEYTIRALHSRGWIEPDGSPRYLTAYASRGRRWSVVELVAVFRHFETSGVAEDEAA